ncbi:MAG: putative metalloprotease CJM1_0395 family protein, partial [Pseudomonadota bacterium]
GAAGAAGRGEEAARAGQAPESRDRRPERGGDGLSDEERAVVRDLAARDREVRAHEQAHATVGRPYAGAPSYVYQVGPDGRRYAVGGSVQIDMSPIEGDPEATAEKMRVVAAAAMAPRDPSAADRAVAAAARALMAQAQAEAASLAAAERRGDAPDAEPGSLFAAAVPPQAPQDVYASAGRALAGALGANASGATA